MTVVGGRDLRGAAPKRRCARIAVTVRNDAFGDIRRPRRKGSRIVR